MSFDDLFFLGGKILFTGKKMKVEMVITIGMTTARKRLLQRAAKNRDFQKRGN